MKYGEYLKSQIEEDWDSYYIDYDRLKDLLKSMEASRLAVPDDGIGTSLSTPLPTTLEGMQLNDITSQEEFFSLLDKEMKKIEVFTKEKVLMSNKSVIFLSHRIVILFASGG